ncbi:hypothetical protein BVRB_4g078500 [Beta vulgaris subsp. vulgaris]|nr:hypothetical protein BVRB_4g078500 [Beta vulgaris subsp. vulgaris]
MILGPGFIPPNPLTLLLNYVIFQDLRLNVLRRWVSLTQISV